jgi:hypothetical protein
MIKMTNEEILKRTWELMPDDITANDFAYTNSIEVRVKEAIDLARADERAKVMAEMKKLPVKQDACYCGSSNCYQSREWVELDKVLKSIK